MKQKLTSHFQFSIVFKFESQVSFFNFINPVRTGEGGVFHQAPGLLTITLEVITVHSRHLVTLKVERR